MEHMLLVCTVLLQSDEHYTADSLGTLFEMVPEACIVKKLGHFIWYEWPYIQNNFLS